MRDGKRRKNTNTRSHKEQKERSKTSQERRRSDHITQETRHDGGGSSSIPLQNIEQNTEKLECVAGATTTVKEHGNRVAAGIGRTQKAKSRRRAGWAMCAAPVYSFSHTVTQQAVHAGQGCAQGQGHLHRQAAWAAHIHEITVGGLYQPLQLVLPLLGGGGGVEEIRRLQERVGKARSRDRNQGTAGAGMRLLARWPRYPLAYAAENDGRGPGGRKAKEGATWTRTMAGCGRKKPLGNR